VHPTAFSDTPSGFKASAGAPLILCAEILRGVGGVILDAKGRRFVDELEKRDVVTAAMNKRMAGQGGRQDYLLVLPPAAAEIVKDHVNIYSGKGLLHKVLRKCGVCCIRYYGLQGRPPTLVHD
jgi:aspartate oxidase